MKKKIVIKGMSCEHCAHHVKEALNELCGVESVNTNLADNSAILEANIFVKDEDVKFFIEDAGYKVVEIEEL